MIFVKDDNDMTRENILNSILLKKRFCKDQNLPISMYENPYFYQRVLALDPIHHSVDSFNQFCLELYEFQDEQQYFEYYNSLKDSVISSIKDSDGFKQFNDGAVWENFMKYDHGKKFVEKNIYSIENDGENFISIDMIKANFSSMRYFDPTIFDNKETWEEYITQFTDKSHIIGSKYIRQVIFGNCNPKRQVTYEKKIMCQLALYLLESIDEIQVYSLHCDEIIIKVANDDDLKQISKKVEDAIYSFSPYFSKIMRVDYFSLHKINGTSGFIKKHADHVDFKCLDSEIYHQVVKYYFGLEITDDDLVFYHNGKLARFLKEVEDPWN